MNPDIAKIVITTFVKEIRRRLESAAAVSRAAHLCAQTGSAERALEIASDLAHDLHEIKRAFEATLTVSHYSKP
jgi:hypothetical protein